jgi:signal transduction histidine kinase
VVVVVVDITERKQAEQALQRAANRLQHLRAIDQAILASHSLAEIAEAALTHIGHLIPSTRTALLLIDMTAQTMTLFALQLQDVLQTPSTTHLPLTIIGDLLDPLMHGQIYHVADIAALPELPAFLHMSHADHLRAFFISPIIVDGELIALLNVGSDQPGAFTAEHIEIAREVADQLSIAIQQARLRAQVERHAQELEDRVVARTAELAAANQELEAFSYSVSHDLRAPLRAIDGFSRILLEDYIADLPDEAQHYFQLVRDNTQQMGQLVDDLLAFARLSRQPLNKRAVVIDELVRQCLEELSAEQTGRQLDIQIGDLPSCVGDPALLKQVWFNLLSNALKYTRRRDPALIEIGCQVQGDAPIYFVKDNGAGFDMRYINKLFGVFQRMHRAEDYEGTGVGLAIVQRIIHRHGGRVWAEAAVDRGATFYFTLAGGSM